MKMKRRLVSVYEAARNGEREEYPYVDYCNTRMSVRVAGDFAVEVTDLDGQRRETAVFDVRNISANAFLDRLAMWVVTGRIPAGEAPADPLEW